MSEIHKFISGIIYRQGGAEWREPACDPQGKWVELKFCTRIKSKVTCKKCINIMKVIEIKKS